MAYFKIVRDLPWPEDDHYRAGYAGCEHHKEGKMERHKPTMRTRREFLWANLALPAAFVLASYIRGPVWTPLPKASAGESALSPTPACGDADDLTPSQTEGPYYKPRSPERHSLVEPGITGTPITLTGTILSRRCQPITRALVDFWQADQQGEYDNKGYRLRGHQFTDGAGRYHLETIVPGRYPGRTRHIHVKVQAPNRPILTTQLYFPGEPRNQTDRIFNPDLLLAIEASADGKVATFNFVLDLV
jgi:protocatechuate 3,4-dioxygenase beta subunit